MVQSIVLLFWAVPALAGTFIDVSATDVDEDAVRAVWDEGAVRRIGVWADEEFQIGATESSPYNIDTCWIYIDGTTTTGTTRNFTLEDYRIHYGCVVILYDNDTYEDYEFHVQGAWTSAPDTGATAPASPSLPADQTAAYLIDAVADNDPDGPYDNELYCICEPTDLCYPHDANKAECGTNKSANPDDCPGGEWDCVNR